MLDRFERVLRALWRGLPAPLWALVLAFALQLSAGPVFAKAHPHSKAGVGASKAAHKSMMRGASKGGNRAASLKAQRSAKGPKATGSQAHRRAMAGARANVRAGSQARGAASRQVGRHAGRHGARGAGRYVAGRAGGRGWAAAGNKRGRYVPLAPGERIVVRRDRRGRKIYVRLAPPRPSAGELAGLHRTVDALELKSSVALVIDEGTHEVLFSKNPGVVLPIASLTKLMTALVVAEAKLPMDELLAVTADDVAGTVGTGARSRLAEGTPLSRGEMLHLALMSSENRAAHVLGRSYPGGLTAFVQAMNAKARQLGMAQTHYVEPTGLSPDNRSSARDLAVLVQAASAHPMIRDYSTSMGALVPVGEKQVAYRNTNRLVNNPEWSIELQKTGYITAAGRCMVMKAQLAGRKLIMVLLDSAGRYSRLGDAERIRQWLLASQALNDTGAEAPVAGLPKILPAGAPAAPVPAIQTR